MNTLEQIEKAVTSLPEDQFRKLCDWVIRLDHRKRDQQIVADSEQGLL